MTNLACDCSGYINGVSMQHEKVSSSMLSNHHIDAITNGVHATTWICPSFQRLYDEHIPEWRRDNLSLRYVIGILVEEIWQAHLDAKKAMVSEIKRRTGMSLDPNVMTIGFARRATAYKRTDFLFSDPERLRKIVKQFGSIQVICGGKAHPQDEGGKALIHRIFAASDALSDLIPVVYLEEYDMSLAKYLVSGVDLWLNTPKKPLEASGTSGMKAALNGVPGFSILDGWWIEGHIEGVTGWSIGTGWGSEVSPAAEIASLYDKLQYVIVPLFYQRPKDYAAVMRSAIAINGSYFNTQRMLNQYVQNAYLRTNNNYK